MIDWRADGVVAGAIVTVADVSAIGVGMTGDVADCSIAVTALARWEVPRD